MNFVVRFVLIQVADLLRMRAHLICNRASSFSFPYQTLSRCHCCLKGGRIGREMCKFSSFLFMTSWWSTSRPFWLWSLHVCHPGRLSLVHDIGSKVLGDFSCFTIYGEDFVVDAVCCRNQVFLHGWILVEMVQMLVLCYEREVRLQTDRLLGAHVVKTEMAWWPLILVEGPSTVSRLLWNTWSGFQEIWYFDDIFVYGGSVR